MKYLVIVFGLAIVTVCCIQSDAFAQRLTQLSPPNITFRAIGIADSSHSMVVGDSASIFTSTGPDTMRIWHVVPAPCAKRHTFNGVSYFDTNHAVVVSDEGLVFRTTNAGMSWQQSASGITGQTLRGITHTANGSLLIVGDSGIVLRSMDSGRSWTKQVAGTTHNINAIAINQIGRGFFVGAHGLIGQTTDFGATWPLVTDTIRNLGVNRDPITFRSVDINPGNSAGMAVGDSGGVARTLNCADWQSLSPQRFGYYGVDSSKFEPVLEKLMYRTIVYTGDGIIEWRAGGDIDLMFWFSGTEMNWQFPSVFGDADGGSDRGIARTQCQAVWRGAAHTFVQYGGPYADIETTTKYLGIGWPGFFDPPGLSIPEVNFLFVSIDSRGKGFATVSGGGICQNNRRWSLLEYSAECGRVQFSRIFDGYLYHRFGECLCCWMVGQSHSDYRWGWSMG